MIKPLALALMAAGYGACAMAAAVGQSGPDVPLVAAEISPKAGVGKQVITRSDRFQPDPLDDGAVERYIIQLNSPALPSYEGGIAGLKATSPESRRFQHRVAAQGPLIDLDSADSQAYRAHLEREQDHFLSKASQVLGTPLNVLEQTHLALNALIVEGTQKQMMTLANLMEVRAISKDVPHELHTDQGPAWIGAGAIWDGAATGVNFRGEGVLVGIIDTGVDTGNRSFSATSDDGYTHTNPFGDGVYKGDCVADASLCNAKLVGVYSWPDITDRYEGTRPANGQDYNGHGSHTAGTAAGNVLYDVAIVDADGNPGTLSFEQISGVAPRANLISYQTCLPGQKGDPLTGCYPSLAIRAIEAAIREGVNVLNYSVGGDSSDPWNDAESVAFLNARAAGIHVATSAGNSGPEPATVGSPGDNPWLTSVGAFTHGRQFHDKALTLTGGETAAPDNITGKSITGALEDTPIVYAGNFSNANDPENDPGQCLEPFPSGTFNGEIVVCDRGTIARVAKGSNVAAGGAAGMILANVQGGSTSVVADPHVIPAIHIDATHGDALKAWLSVGDNHRGNIPATTIDTNPDDADVAAEFTSRGPNPSVPDVMVPHVAAPGVSIYAAYASETPFKSKPNGKAFSFLSGTSMASPHVAGALALIAGTRPEWTPAEAQSALMLTATQNARKEGGSRAADFFDMGAGRIQVDKAINSPLVLNESRDGYLAASPALEGRPSEINMASMAESRCVGICGWTRTIKATRDGSFTATGVAIDDGLTLRVEPASFTLKAGESLTLQVTANVMNASSNAWAKGNVEIDNGVDVLRMPVMAHVSTGSLPRHVSLTANRNADSWLLPDITSAPITEFTVTSYGLTKALLQEGTVMQGGEGCSPFEDDGKHSVNFLLEVPEGSKRLVAEILHADAPDLDLFIGIDANQDGLPQEEEMLANSRSGTALEKLDLLEPTADSYWVVVQSCQASEAEASDAFTLATAVIDGNVGENLRVEGPSSIGALETYDLRLLWDEEMEEGDHFYGAIELGTDPDNQANLGMMRVDLVRGGDDVSVSGSVDSGERLKAGDQVDIEVTYLPNFNPEDRQVDVSLKLPYGLAIDEESLPEGATFHEETLTLPTVTLPSRFGVPMFKYEITSNRDDASCDLVMPGASHDGGYLNLENFNIKTNSTLSGDGQLWGWMRTHTFLGQEYRRLYISDDGFVTFADKVGDAPHVNQMLPSQLAPNNLLAFLWRDSEVVYDAASNSGITLARLGGISILEYDNLIALPDGEDMVDMVIVFNEAVGEGPEIVVAFDNVVHVSGSALGATIGYEDTLGKMGEAVLYHAANDSAGSIGNLETDIQNGTIFCFDQQPLELGNTVLRFSAVIAEGFAGGELALSLASETDAVGTQKTLTFPALTFDVEGAPAVTINGEQHLRLEGMEGSTMTLEGAYVEPNGDTVELAWRQVDGIPVTLADNGGGQASFTLPMVDEDTELTFEFTASDGQGEGRATAVAKVLNNRAPNVSVTDVSVQERQNLTLSATVQDHEGDELSYQWSQVSGPSAEIAEHGASAVITAPDVEANETLTFEVAVSDGLNVTTARAVVTVLNNQSPRVTLSGGAVQEGQTLTLKASASDPEGDSLSYQWQQISGPSAEMAASGASATITAPEVSATESLTFEVTVSDGINTVTQSAEVEVTNVKRRKGGGGMGWLVLLLIPLALARRRHVA